MVSNALITHPTINRHVGGLTTEILMPASNIQFSQSLRTSVFNALLIPTLTGWQREVHPSGMCSTFTPSCWIVSTTYIIMEENNLRKSQKVNQSIKSREEQNARLIEEDTLFEAEEVSFASFTRCTFLLGSSYKSTCVVLYDSSHVIQSSQMDTQWHVLRRVIRTLSSMWNVHYLFLKLFIVWYDSYWHWWIHIHVRLLP